jgi:hypothetical protein
MNTSDQSQKSKQRKYISETSPASLLRSEGSLITQRDLGIGRLRDEVFPNDIGRVEFRNNLSYILYWICSLLTW